MNDFANSNLPSEDLELDRPTSRLICIYHALSHPIRLTICKHLLVRSHTVSELNELLGEKQYVVSQQLAVLRNSDIVETERQSRHILYSLRSEAARRILRVSIRNVSISEISSSPKQSYKPSGFAKIRN